MNLRVSLLSAAIGATVIATVFPMSASAGEFRAARKPVPGQYIVVLKDDAASLATESDSRARVANVASEMSTRHRARLVRSYGHALRGFVAQADDQALAKLIADPRVAYVEEDGYVSISATQSGATWGIDRIDQRARPLNGTYVYNTTAAGVHAYIIDTGVLLSHTQFTGRMGNGFDAVTSGGNANDCNGHGTHVAGTVGGSTYGVAKGVTIHPVRVLGCNGSGTNSGVIAGMDWVAQNRIRPAVANMSLGGGASQATDHAVQRMVNAVVTVVVAAGNDNGNACSYSPARAPNAITVGSTTNTDARSSFSNFGTCLDIFGPGSSITSAWYTGTTATNTISGTSMAAPHVAGVAALYLATNTGASPAQVVSAINASATTGVVTNPGTGSPNRLLYSLFGTAPPPPPPPADTVVIDTTLPNVAAGSRSSFYTVTIPAGTTKLVVATSGGTGDADLYVRLGSAPTTSTYTCRPYLSGNNETCTINSPAAGAVYYIGVRAYTAYSGVNLKATISK